MKIHSLLHATRVGRYAVGCVAFIVSFTFGGRIGIAESAAEVPPFYDITVKSITGEPVPLNAFKGQVVVVANTASKCGFTSQYADLEALYRKYKDRGLVVLGFPSNDFGSQEPGSNEEIQSFCTGKFGVTFPLFSKGPVRGPEKQPLFRFLTSQSENDLDGEIKWNFEKFIIDRNGKLRARFNSFTNPMSARVTETLEELLKEQP